MSRTRKRRITIVGLGLIGGSLGLALQRQGWERTGWDVKAAARGAARRRGAVDRVTRTLAEAVEDAELIVLAAPPRANLSLLRLVAGANGTATVTDVGSVKGEIARAGRRVLGSRFVPGHPMAGDAGRGLGAARADLFAGAAWALCGGGTPHRRRVRTLVRAVGARPVVSAPARHDRDVALVSHLPQLVASLAVGEVARRRSGALALAGRAFREWGRLAGSPVDLWLDIAGDNAANIRCEMQALETALRRFRRAWDDNPEELRRALHRGQRGARRLRRPL